MKIRPRSPLPSATMPESAELSLAVEGGTQEVFSKECMVAEWNVMFGFDDFGTHFARDNNIVLRNSLFKYCSAWCDNGKDPTTDLRECP